MVNWGSAADAVWYVIAAEPNDDAGLDRDVPEGGPDAWAEAATRPDRYPVALTVLQRRGLVRRLDHIEADLGHHVPAVIRGVGQLRRPQRAEAVTPRAGLAHGADPPRPRRRPLRRSGAVERSASVGASHRWEAEGKSSTPVSISGCPDGSDVPVADTGDHDTARISARSAVVTDWQVAGSTAQRALLRPAGTPRRHQGWSAAAG